MSFRCPFIDQHTRRHVVDEVSRRNSDHRRGFVFPHVHDLPRDDFAGLRSEANGRAYFEVRVFLLRHNRPPLVPAPRS